VQPSNGRLIEPGDIVLAEITPSVGGQLTQICRTVVIGKPSDELRAQIRAGGACHGSGHRGRQAGRRHVGSVPRHQHGAGGRRLTANTAIRRTSGGAGTASASPSVRPGDVALDNATVLEPDMLFMIHPNQYLPEPDTFSAASRCC